MEPGCCMAGSNCPKRVIRFGSRRSELAIIQTKFVINELSKVHKGYDFDIVLMDTTGDQVLDRSLSKVGTKGLFTDTLENALKNKEIDGIVHSLKDVPTTLTDGTCLTSVLNRDASSDVVVFSSKISEKYSRLKDLPDGSIIGTSSLRRIAQLKLKYPRLAYKSIRGNIQTRLSKLDGTHDKSSINYSAIILARAALSRLSLESRVGEDLGENGFLYAVGQGAITVQCCSTDSLLKELFNPINNYPTIYCVIAERSFLKILEGGCSVPIGVMSTFNSPILTLKVGIFTLNSMGNRSLNLEDFIDISSESSYSEGSFLEGFNEKINEINNAAWLGCKLANYIIENHNNILNEAKESFINIECD